MTHVLARAWIKRLPERRGDPVDAGAKAVLQELWDRVDWTRTDNSPARDCYPSRRRMAEDLGTSVDVIKKRLVMLAAAGWIRRERDGWALAWGEPFTRVAEAPGNTVPAPRVIQSPAPGTLIPTYQSLTNPQPSQRPSQVRRCPTRRAKPAPTSMPS